MLRTLIERIQQRYRTIPFPANEEALPDRFLGRPDIVSSGSFEEFLSCQRVCPTGAIVVEKERLSLDLGKCLFCGECQKVCLKKSIVFTRDYRIAVRKRRDLILDGPHRLRVESLDQKMKAIFGRSLRLRQVSAGGCNGCELDTNVLSTVVFDLGRFGVQFVASPRHADGLLITGPVSKNMRMALEKTYAAVPSPKIVIAVGACAISGGPYRDHAEVCNGADAVVPVDLYIPGCPPHPLTILDGLVGLLGQIKSNR